MPKDSVDFICGAVAGFLISLLVLCYVAGNLIEQNYMKQAVVHNAATYVIKNGVPVFTWNDEIKK